MPRTASDPGFFLQHVCERDVVAPFAQRYLSYDPYEYVIAKDDPFNQDCLVAVLPLDSLQCLL